MNTTISFVIDRKFRLWFCIIFFVTSIYDNYYCYFMYKSHLFNMVSLHYPIKFSDFCTFVSSCTRHHSLAIVPSRSTINAFRYSFFVNVPFIWNTIPHHILSFNNVNKFCSALRTFFLFFSFDLVM